jgi:FRG domain
MSNSWRHENLTTEGEIFSCLAELQGKGWCCRGQSQHWPLLPKIDRGKREGHAPIEKLKLERESIDIFRATAKFFSPGEHNSLVDDNIALAVLRHYGVPTRFLDWTTSPHVAAYFAVCDNDKEDGEVWSFDSFQYEDRGKEQWKSQPETTTDHSGHHEKFKAQLTQFSTTGKYDWIICMSYPEGFHRQKAQKGLYTLSAQFGRDHADLMAKLLDNSSYYCRYVICKTLKPKLRQRLREDHDIWRGSLFPDAAGAAETVLEVVFKK